MSPRAARALAVHLEPGNPLRGHDNQTVDRSAEAVSIGGKSCTREFKM
jgi:hypothetical protein